MIACQSKPSFMALCVCDVLVYQGDFVPQASQGSAKLTGL